MKTKSFRTISVSHFVAACVTAFSISNPSEFCLASQAANFSPTFAAFIKEKAAKSFTQTPDYSYAGYHYSESPLPTITRDTHAFFDVTQYGAVPNDDQSDYNAVAEAISAAEALGSPAVIYFPPGRYNLREEADVPKGRLVIRKSNIVIIGSGAYAGGTEIFIRKAAPRSTDSTLFQFLGEPEKVPTKKATANITSWKDPFTAVVDNSNSLKTGQLVAISCKTTPEQTQKLQGDLPLETRKEFKMQERHEIVSVRGNEIVFREPLLDSFRLVNQIREISPPISEVGIQDIAFIGNHRERWGHYINPGADGYAPIDFKNCRNGWINNLRCSDLAHNLQLTDSSAITILNVAFEGSPGHMLTRFAASDRNLWAYSRENSWYWHGLGASWSCAGNVFLRCAQYAGIEGHGSGPYASLFDLNSGIFKHRPGGDWPHHNRDLMFWNWLNLEAQDYEGYQAKLFLYPSVIGLHGAPFNVEPKAAEQYPLELESNGTEVYPDSLFEAQLALRLGSVPDWIKDQGALFEKFSRFPTMTWASPATQREFVQGQPVPVEFQIDPHYSYEKIEKVEVLATHTHYLDGKERVMTQITTAPFKKEITLTPGVWSLRGRLFNKRGEFTDTQPITVFVGTSAEFTQITPAEFTAYLYQTHIGEQEARGHGEVASLSPEPLIDANTETLPNFKAECGVLFLDFGKPVQLARVDVCPGDTSGISMEIQGGDAPELLKDLTNRTDGWNPLGGLGPAGLLWHSGEPRIIQKSKTSRDWYPLWLPENSGYRYYKIVFRPERLHWGHPSVREIRLFKAASK
ncbi:MAG: DUF4955 domain-containing protein [Verrucomicrobiota bacterium]